MIAPFGKIVIIGNRGSIEINPRLAMQKECDILAMPFGIHRRRI